MTQILVVEDDPDLRVTLRQALTAAGYTVDTAADGQTALAAVAGRSYALVVLDSIESGEFHTIDHVNERMKQW